MNTLKYDLTIVFKKNNVKEHSGSVGRVFHLGLKMDSREVSCCVHEQDILSSAQYWL